ncbi:MAG: hypothetical protein NWE99_10830 [Candidatus Bathyarchaeota archaeon]|nr:hypothetical protein [Candidatus Bathyarchaeota archaeon]
MPVTPEMLKELAETTRLAEQKASAEDARYCPICGSKLHVDGKRLRCDRHGEMRVYMVYPP